MTKHVIDCGPFSSVLIGTKSHHIIGNAVFGIPALTSARKAVGFLLLPILFALVGLLALTATQVYGQSTVPSKPASFSATAGDSRVTISWNDPNAPTITKYQYRRSIDAGNNWSPNWAELPGSGASTATRNFLDGRMKAISCATDFVPVFLPPSTARLAPVTLLSVVAFFVPHDCGIVSARAVGGFGYSSRELCRCAS